MQIRPYHPLPPPTKTLHWLFFPLEIQCKFLTRLVLGMDLTLYLSLILSHTIFPSHTCFCSTAFLLFLEQDNLSYPGYLSSVLPPQRRLLRHPVSRNPLPYFTSSHLFITLSKMVILFISLFVVSPGQWVVCPVCCCISWGYYKDQEIVFAFWDFQSKREIRQADNYNTKQSYWSRTIKLRI